MHSRKTTVALGGPLPPRALPYKDTMLTAFDCETFLIGPESVVPKVICVAFHNVDESFVLSNADPGLVSRLKFMLNNEEITGANTRYDLACVAITWPELIPDIFKALVDGRVHDIQIREKLANLWRHGDIDYGPTGKPVSYSLASLAYRYVGLDLFASKEGEDIWRVRYHELDGVPSAEFPPEAYEYARMDAQATWEVHLKQPQDCPSWSVEPLHVFSSFCLQLMTMEGLEIDGEEKERLSKEIEDALSPENMEVLYTHGILIPASPPRPYKAAKDHAPGCLKKKCSCPPKIAKGQPEKLNKKHGLVPLVESICEASGTPMEYTDKGGVSTAKDFLEKIAGYHIAIQHYLKRQNLNKLKTSYLPSLEWPFGSGQTAKTVHPDYDPLKRTGRVSSRGNTKAKASRALYPSVAIQVADPRVRSVYKPRDGHVFSVCDYTAIDLCSLAQTMYDLFGWSTHREQFNNDIDPHSFLGAVLAFSEDKEFRKKAWDLAGKDDLAVYNMFLDMKEERPSWFKHWRKFAKPVGLGFPGGMGSYTMVSLCASYGITISQHRAVELKKIWLQVYPDMQRYLNVWVPGANGTYVSPRGMVRVNCNYTETANGRALQTPAAEGMKEAMCLVSRACYDSSVGSILYGCRPVVNMHDELVLEVPVDEHMWARRDEHSRLMIEGMRSVIKDVKIKAEANLVRRWTKSAVPLDPSSFRSSGKE